MEHRPPKFAKKILRWFVNAEFVEEIEGDLDELFYERLAVQSAFRAKLKYILDVLHAIRPYQSKRKPTLVGGEYTIETVSPEPAQILIFEEERMSSSVIGFDNFKFYEILTDMVTQTKFVAFYKNRPPLQYDDLGPTYSFRITGQTLRLDFRFCIEGCHLGFRRIK